MAAGSRGVPHHAQTGLATAAWEGSSKLRAGQPTTLVIMAKALNSLDKQPLVLTPLLSSVVLLLVFLKANRK